ncbi:hypothetical protein [Flavobacterium sharifuzzamanii]|uniref:hypothetical protein n=1 Tax=Flavobacterium sharifuzzamanii TaxID=2211133 RepID=UPI000DAC3B4A|nr:hypothetical protein [Flavobacterium sharifuzzamanii]KAF2082934.1 hypothetical protein DMA14_01045 [Flavobacterium sharifuzzamanii]
MTKTRRVGGNATYNVRGTTRIFANEIEINSNGRIDYYAPEYTYGEPEPRPIREEPEKAFSGWWSPDYEGIRNIPEQDANCLKAYLEETVYFQLNVSDNIPVGTSITFQLWDKNTPFKGLTIFDNPKFDGKMVYKTAMVREVNGQHRITIELYLDPKWHIEIKKDEKGSINSRLEFYWTWKYHNTYWKSNDNILGVYRSKTTLFIKPAYEGYNFPEIRTSDGDIVVFSKGIGLKQAPSEELENQLNTIADNIKGEMYGDVREAMMKYSDNIRHTIAVRQLKRGYLASNMGKTEFSRKIYTKPIYDNSGELYEITKAGNFGYRKDGKLVTTKGISQLDYFKEVGSFNTIAKASKELLGIFDFASDVISLAMDENPKIIPTGFAPLDFLVAVVMPSISNPIIEVWDNVVFELAEKAKDKGLKGVDDFLHSSGAQEKRYRYGITKIGQEILEKLLKGEFKTLEELEEKQLIKNQYQENLPYVLFHYTQYKEDLDKDIVFIDSIFANF